MNRVKKTLYEWCINNNNTKILNEWNIDNLKSIKEVGYSSRYLASFTCSNKHHYNTSVVNRVKSNGCPYCSNKKVLKGYNDLGSLYPNLLKEWDYDKNTIDPFNIVYGSDSKVYWKCSNNHSFVSKIRKRTILNYKCPYCNNKNRTIKNTLYDFNPSYLLEWDYEKNNEINPKSVSYASTKKVWWICKKGHSFNDPIASRYKGSSCPICSNRVIVSGINDFASKYPLLIKEWDFESNNINPYKSMPKSHDIIHWKCSKGHKWSSLLYSRVKGTKCLVCLNKLILKGYNDLDTTNPLIAKQWNYELNKDLTPFNIGSGSGKVVYWNCDKGHIFKSSIVKRTKYNFNCPICKQDSKRRLINDIK